MSEERARIFLSCGQRKDTEESRIAQEIKDVLYEKGYDPYIAIQEQTLDSLKENIFAKLSDSEYLLFIDFPRNRIGSKKGKSKYRGSLFSHQELAIASYLQFDDVIAFQHEDVELEGMMEAMQLNALPFKDTSQLPKMVIEEIGKRDWRPNWKNNLQIDIKGGEYRDANIHTGAGTKLARFFHLTVKNKHRRKIALGCTAYLESLTKLPEYVTVPIETIELKWVGYTMPMVAIMPESCRDLDAFYVMHDTPHILRFSCFTDSDYYGMPILGQGELKLAYVVISENFPTTRLTVKASLGNNVDSTSLEAYI